MIALSFLSRHTFIEGEIMSPLKLLDPLFDVIEILINISIFLLPFFAYMIKVVSASFFHFQKNNLILHQQEAFHILILFCEVQVE